jgi:hypothetical protein
LNLANHFSFTSCSRFLLSAFATYYCHPSQAILCYGYSSDKINAPMCRKWLCGSSRSLSKSGLSSKSPRAHEGSSGAELGGGCRPLTTAPLARRAIRHAIRLNFSGYRQAWVCDQNGKTILNRLRVRERAAIRRRRLVLSDCETSGANKSGVIADPAHHYRQSMKGHHSGFGRLFLISARTRRFSTTGTGFDGLIIPKRSGQRSRRRALIPLELSTVLFSGRATLSAPFLRRALD